MTTSTPRRIGLIALGVLGAPTVGTIPPALAAPAPPSPPPAAPTDTPPPGADRAHRLTLITGDTLTVPAGDAAWTLRRADGTTPSFHRTVLDGDTYVYPDDALPYVSTGVLDRQLFNVTGLIEVATDRTGHAGRRTPLTVRSQQLPEIDAAVDEIAVEVSYDDGATWQRSALTRTGTGWLGRHQAPRGAQFVSPRTAARDSAGNTVTQTIIRAYGVR